MTVTTDAPDTIDGDDDPTETAAVAPGSDAPPDSLEVVRSPVLMSLARWIAFVAVSGVALYPVLTTPIVADDFVMPFSQIDVAGLNPLTIWHWAITSAPTVGHFNFLGQFVGGTTSLIWMLLISNGVRFTTVFGATKLIVFLLCALAGARFVREGLLLAGVTASKWWCRIVVAVAIFATLQIHLAWSNDPTASFPGAGFASAAFGLWYLSVVAGAVRRDDWRSAILASALGIGVVLYYEINVAAVVAAAPMVAFMLLRDRNWKRPATIARGGIVLGVPAVMTLIIQILVSPAAANYDGTKISQKNSALGTFGKGMVSSLPGAAWPRSREWLNYPVPIRTVPLAMLLAMFLVLWFLARRFGVRPDLALGSARQRLALASVAVAPVLYWAMATGIQALTKKVQDEVVGIGMVYNFYAVGSVCFAVLVVVGWSVLPRFRFAEVVAPIAVGLLVVFAAVQYLVNSELSRRQNEVMVPNRELLAAYSDEAPVVVRCAAIRTWTAGDWPDYYEDQVVSGIEKGYREFHQTEFCPGYDRVAEGLGVEP